ncbi:MAG: helix-turn-helix domain-containing protein [Actinomycetota bacterium]
MVSAQRRGPGSQAGELHPTHRDLLNAAMRVAERDGLDGLSVSEVTREAGVAKGTFYLHFADREALLVRLHQQFHDGLFNVTLEKTSSLDPGVGRVKARITAFLDGCRQQEAVRALLLQSRSQPAIMSEVARRNSEAAALLKGDLLGHTEHPAETAALLVAATAEVALHELEAREELPFLRAALFGLIPRSRNS